MTRELTCAHCHRHTWSDMTWEHVCLLSGDVKECEDTCDKQKPKHIEENKDERKTS